MADYAVPEELGGPFIVQMLFTDRVCMPGAAVIESALSAHMGSIEPCAYGQDMAGYCVKAYGNKKHHPRVFILGCDSFDGSQVNDFLKSQMWDAREERNQILHTCRYMVTAMDLDAQGLAPKERAALTMDLTEALSDLFPECQAFYFHNCGKLLPAKDVRAHALRGLSRFVRFGVNARYFNIDGQSEVLVDTVGLSLLGLPDLQYNFHSMDPNWVVNHAYNMAAYLLEGSHPVKNGDRIDGIEDGNIRPDIRWECRYEVGLIQPVRTVLDISMGRYAGPKTPLH